MYVAIFNSSNSHIFIPVFFGNNGFIINFNKLYAVLWSKVQSSPVQVCGRLSLWVCLIKSVMLHRHKGLLDYRNSVCERWVRVWEMVAVAGKLVSNDAHSLSRCLFLSRSHLEYLVFSFSTYLCNITLNMESLYLPIAHINIFIVCAKQPSLFMYNYYLEQSPPSPRLPMCMYLYQISEQ